MARLRHSEHPATTRESAEFLRTGVCVECTTLQEAHLPGQSSVEPSLAINTFAECTPSFP